MVGITYTLCKIFTEITWKNAHNNHLKVQIVKFDIERMLLVSMAKIFFADIVSDLKPITDIVEVSTALRMMNYVYLILKYGN